jgi:hypothetical protein
VALLRQYAAGALAPAAQHRVEAHTLACPRCADVLAGLQQTPPATTDQALAHLQQRLRQRVQQQTAPARHDREAQRNRWLIPQLAAAAALLLGLVAGGWWAWQQRQSHQPPVSVAVMSPTPAGTTAPAAPASPRTEAAVAAPESSTVARPASRAVARASHQPRAAQAHAGHISSSAALAADSTAVVASTATNTSKPQAALALPAPAAPVASAPATTPLDSAALKNRLGNLAINTKKAASYDATPLRLAAMPAAPKLPPAPAGGYSALREKLRREAAEFKPEAPEQPLSGTVQLRLTIGADGKIQQTKVLRGLREDYDEEAQRLVCDGPGWVPGISGGKRAPLDVDIAVPF